MAHSDPRKPRAAAPPPARQSPAPRLTPPAPDARGPGGHGLYRALMRSHDRVATRHLGDRRDR